MYTHKFFTLDVFQAVGKEFGKVCHCHNVEVDDSNLVNGLY